MGKPPFEAIVQRLESYSQNLKDNSQLGNSKLMMAFAEMITVMAWQSSQQDTNNIQIANLIGEIKKLRGSIEEANKNSGKLERANYRLQLILVALTVLTTLIATFPIFKALFQWSAPLISGILRIPLLSPNIIANLATGATGVFTAIVAISFYTSVLSEKTKMNKLKEDLNAKVKELRKRK